MPVKKKKKGATPPNNFYNTCTIVCKNLPGMGNADQLTKKRDFINRHLKDSIIMLQELKIIEK